MDRQVDVLIVGGGLVGLSLACALAPAGLSVALVDAAPAPEAPTSGSESKRDGFTLNAAYDLRVSAINPASRDFLQRIGGWPEEKRVCAFTDMLVWDGRGTSKIEFSNEMIGEPAMGYIVENRNIIARLTEQARGIEDLTLLFDQQIESVEKGGRGYRVTLDGGEVLKGTLLVGADGGNSIVREACNIRAVKWAYGQEALVTTIETERPHGFVARQCFTSIGPLAFLPLAGHDERLCSIVWSTDHADTLLALDDEALCERLTRASEAVLGDVLGVDRRASFPLQQQHAITYVRRGLALVGDAAHTIHPLAGQGANIGLADARALAVTLKECRFSGQGPGDLAVLRRYQRIRQPANLAVASVMEAFQRLYVPDNPLVNWLRNTGTRFVDGNRVLKSAVMKLASGR